MTVPGIIILKREAGPTPGFDLVTVADGPTGSSTLAVPSRIAGTPRELQAIRQMLDNRAARKDATRGEGE